MRSVVIVITSVFLLFFASCNRCKQDCVHGVCIEKSCACHLWYGGDGCEELSLAQYIGYYRGELVADTMRQNVGFNLISDPSAPSILFCDSLSIDLRFVDDTRFDIDAQSWEGKSVFGDGEMLIEAISFQFKSSADTTNRQYTVLAFRRN